MKYLYYLTVLVLLTTVLFYYAYRNLGIYLDATTAPENTDLLVCLGGGACKEKTLSLYKAGYLKSDTILFTTYRKKEAKTKKEDSRITYMQAKVPCEVQLVLNDKTYNTVEEVLYIKRYMVEHGLKKVSIITGPPHARRTLLFFKLFKVPGDKEIEAKIISNGCKTWQAEKYYARKDSKRYAFSEIAKIAYGIAIYAPLYYAGLLEWYIDGHHEAIKMQKEYLGKWLDGAL